MSYDNRMKTKKQFTKGAIAFFAGVALLSLVSLLAACAGVPRADFGGLGQGTDAVPFMRDVRTGTLPSGLRYFILENSMPANRAHIRLAVRAGSLHEEEHEQGLAHFVEHMAFRGTEGFPETELMDYLRALGMRLGPDVNAFVSFDRTVYMLEVPVITDDDGTRGISATALAIIDEWSRAIAFDPELTELERLVVIEEYRGMKGAWDRVRRAVWPTLFRGSRFAERMPIGQLEVIETAPVEHLIAFYQRWYRADNMAIIFVGDFDGAALEASLVDHFHIQAPPAPTAQPEFDLPPPRRGNIDSLVFTDPELTSTQVLLYFLRAPERARNDIAAFRQGVIEGLIQSMIARRFQEAALSPDAPFMGVWSGGSRWGASSRMFGFEAQAKTGRAEDTMVELLRAKEAIRRHGFHPTEIELAKSALVSNVERLVQESDRQQSATLMNQLMLYYFDGGFLPDPDWQLAAIRQMLPGITEREINNAARDLFAGNDISAFIVAPDSEAGALPSEATIAQLVSRRSRLAVQRPQAIEVADRILPFVPDRGFIVAEEVDAETGATIWQLGNGARVILQATDNRNDEIIMHAMARGGTSSASDADGISALLANDMMSISGIGPWSTTDLSRMLAASQVGISTSIGPYTRSVQGSSTTGDLRAFFELIHLTFADPRIDPEMVEVLMNWYRTSLAHHDEDPQSVFFDEASRIISGNHPRYRPLELADLDRADIATALAFLQRSLNPADFTFAFVGNLTPELMRDYVEFFIASIPPRGERLDSWTDLGITRPGRIERNIYSGIEDQTIVWMAWFAPAEFSEQLSITAQVATEYLNTRLFQEIRDNLGGVYWIGSALNVTIMPSGEMALHVQFGCDPERAAELSDAVQALMEQTARGLNMTAFVNAQEAMRQSFEVSMQNNVFIAQSYANSAVMFNLPLSRLNRRPEYINAVTPADVQNLVARLLLNGPARMTLFAEARDPSR